MGLAAKLLVVSSSLAYAALRARSAPVRFGLYYAAGVGFCIAGAASLDVPWLLGKRRSDGKVPVWSYVVFSTFHLGFRVYVKIRRLVSEEPVYTKVTPEWYVGGWPFALGDAPTGNLAVIDCTCELERTAVVADLPYLNLPAFDSRCPKLDYFHEGVRWALEQQQAGRAVFVHCAFGHGRSVAVLCACLVAHKEVASWQEAFALIKSVRPRVRLNRIQRATLVSWCEQYTRTGKM